MISDLGRLGLPEIEDPEAFARLLVQQYLEECGMGQALQATESVSGIRYDHNKLPRGSLLMQMIYHVMEHQLAEEGTDDAAAAQAAEEEALLQGGNSDWPNTVVRTVAGLHGASIISICCCTDSNGDVMTGSGNGCIQRVDTDQSMELWHWNGSKGGVLSLALSPTGRLLAAGTMDGSLLLLDAGSGELLQALHPHRRYVVAVRWSPDGRHLATASWDDSVCMLRCTGPADGAAEVQLLRQVPFTQHVEDVGEREQGQALPSTAPGMVGSITRQASLVAVPAFSPSCQTVIAAVRGSNYLRLFDINTQQESSRVNLNALGDDHTSFSPTQLAISPDGAYMLVSTDTPRILMLRLADWAIMRSFVGLRIDDKFHQACTQWLGDGFYFAAAAAGGRLAIFHVGTAKIVADIKVHAEKNVRGMALDHSRNMLVTCSFDKSLKVLQHQAGA